MSTPTASCGGKRIMIILADDLSGAQECIAAASWLPVGDIGESVPAAATVMLDEGRSLPDVEIIAADINSRCLSSTEAINKTKLTLDLLENTDPKKSNHQVFFKFDSILRGNIAAQLGAASDSLGPVVFCPAVPALNRVVRNGVVQVNGVPLHETGLWHLESEFAPESVSEIFTDLDPTTVSLDELRSGELASKLKSVSPSTQVVVCDAETDEDLDVLAAAIREAGLAAAGASGLCAALARVTPPASSELLTESIAKLDSATTTDDDSGDIGASFIIGTASNQARAQVKRLSEEGLPVVSWRPGFTRELPNGDCVVTVSGPIRSEESADIDKGLAQLVADNHRGRDLFLTGGQTARSILDALTIAELRPLAQPEFGTVVSRTPDGRLVVTRPGSFGSTDNLILSFRTLKHLRALYAPNERTSS